MKISSPAFAPNHEIPPEYTCDGDNISPPLEIAEVPPEAKSLVLIIDDPDTPEGTFTHWLVWNIEPTAQEVNEGEVPRGGVEGMNDSGEPNYTGPCPPHGIHHYIFHLYALDKTLDLGSGSSRAEVEEEIAGHTIAHAQLSGLYSRKEDREDHLREIGEDQEE